MNRFINAVNLVFLMIISCMLFLFIPFSYGATLQSITKSQVEKVFVKKTLTSIGVDNLNGKTVDNSNTVYLNGKGGVIGKMGQKPQGLPQVDYGQYSIASDGKVYIQWQHWDGKKQLCFHIYETKNAIITVDCYNVYHSTFMKSDIKEGDHITQH